MCKVSILMALAFFSTMLLAQTPKTDVPPDWMHRLQAEAGFTNPNGSIKEGLAVRQNISSYYAGQSSQGQISATTTGLHAGFRYEIFHPGKRLGLSAGVRFTTYTTTITGYSSQNADFFYLRYASEGVDTKFARVKSISENNKHLGIPLEIKYVLFGFENVQCYLKGGIESAYRLHHNTGIEFQDPAMEAYTDDVVAGFSTEVSTFTSTVYPVIGIQIGNQKFKGVNVEALLPSFFLSGGNFSLIETERYSGFRISYQLPIGQ